MASVLKVAGHGDHDLPGAVILFYIGQDVLVRQRLDRLPGPQDGAAKGMIGPDRVDEELMDIVVRRVLHALDFLQDDLAFLLQLRRIEPGAEEDVRQEINGLRQVFVEHFDVVRGRLLGGESVHLAAERIHLDGDVLGGPLLRSFEEQMLDKMRNAPQLLRFVAGAHLDPYADGYRA
jgi:hypothetical protein